MPLKIIRLRYGKKLMEQICAGESRCALNQRLGINRCTIQCWSKKPVLYKTRDSSIVAYNTETQQTVNLVFDTIRLEIKGKKKESLWKHIHSDQEIQYSSQAYGIVPSISRKKFRMTTLWQNFSSLF